MEATTETLRTKESVTSSAEDCWSSRNWNNVWTRRRARQTTRTTSRPLGRSRRPGRRRDTASTKGRPRSTGRSLPAPLGARRAVTGSGKAGRPQHAKLPPYREDHDAQGRDRRVAQRDRRGEEFAIGEVDESPQDRRREDENRAEHEKALANLELVIVARVGTDRPDPEEPPL